MRIVKIIPINRGVLNEELTYFSANDVAVGATVLAPFRDRKITGLVVSVEEAVRIKSQIRGSNFALKKIIQVRNSQFLLPEFVRAAEKISDYAASPKSLVLSSLIPKMIIENLTELKLKSGFNVSGTGGIQTTKPKIIQAPDQERFSTYKSLIRENFAQGKSVMVIGPVVSELEYVFIELSRGIEKNSFLIAGRFSPKKIIKLWQKVLTTKHPILLVGTSISLSLPRSDLGTIILEGESGSYKQLQRPYLDLRRFAEFLTEAGGTQLIFGDNILSLEAIKKLHDGSYQELSPPYGRLVTAARNRMIDMRKSDKDLPGKDKQHDKFPIFSPELISLIKETKNNGSRMLLVVNRRGLYPTTLCRDCGDILFCGRCASPLVLHQFKTKRIFICHKCQDVSKPTIRCRKCGSWNLKTLGVGIELVVKEASEFFPAKKIFRLDSDTAKNPKAAKEMVEAFALSQASLMVATERVILYLKEPIDCVAIVSLDNLFTIPDFNIGEKVFRLLIKLKSLAGKEFLIQTRYPDYPSLIQGLKGNIMEFFRQESEERKKFDYPPFSMLIKISRQGQENAVTGDLEKLAQRIKSCHPIIVPAFTPRIKNLYRAHIILKTEPGNWPEPKLVSLLKSLPLKFSVDVEPVNLI